jgi:hypothetical protein
MPAPTEWGGEEPPAAAVVERRWRRELRLSCVEMKAPQGATTAALRGCGGDALGLLAVFPQMSSSSSKSMAAIDSPLASSLLARSLVARWRGRLCAC